jgi:hypothetical protein
MLRDRTRYVLLSFAAFSHDDLLDGVREMVGVMTTIVLTT